MEANKILSADVLDLVFEHRNKDYGAYQLRKTYNKRIIRALVITGSVALLALLGSFLANKLDSGPSKDNIKEVTLQDIPQDDEKPPPPPPPPPKPPDPPKIEMEKFTPPKIVKDEEVKEPPPEQKQLEEVKISDIKQEGIKDEGLAAPVEIDQGKQIIEEKKDDDHIFEKVEIEASFKGGEGAWKKYLERNLNPNVPVDNGAPEGTYTVYVQFVVSKDGSISDVKALTNHGYGMEAEAMKVIKKGPAWVPAVQNGRSVNAYRKQPITFQVTSE
jgi:periplasmic protein TonB